jgi:hypothetical protein
MTLRSLDDGIIISASNTETLKLMEKMNFVSRAFRCSLPSIRQSSSPSSLVPDVQRSSSEVTQHVSSQESVRYRIRDPLAFLIEPERLTKSERIWQRVFVGVPWLIFPLFVLFPFYICSLKKFPES